MPAQLPPIDIAEQGIYNPPDEDNICLICHDLLVGGEESSQNNPPHTLECKHKYHANCIITWFRSGNMNCPYCGDMGVNAPKNNKRPAGRFLRSRYRSWYDRSIVDTKYERLRQYSRRKDAPVQLVKMVDKLRNLEQELKNATEAAKKLEHEPSHGQTWKEIDNERRRLRGNMWKINGNINKQKCAISTYPVIPLIIPKIIT